MKDKIIRFGKGLADGLLMGVPSAVKNAKNSPEGGKGKHDKSKNLGYVVALLIVLGVIFDFIEVKEGESLFKFLVKFGFWV